MNKDDDLADFIISLYKNIINARVKLYDYIDDESDQYDIEFDDHELAESHSNLYNAQCAIEKLNGYLTKHDVASSDYLKKLNHRITIESLKDNFSDIKPLIPK